MKQVPMRAQTRILAMLASILSLFGACSEERGGPAASSSPVVRLTYWPAPNPQEIQLADTLVKVWNRMHPLIQIDMQPIPVSQSTEEVLLAAIAGGTTPDICSNIWPGALHDYTRAGGLIPLDRFADFDSVATSRVPGELLQIFRSLDRHYYQFPWKTNPVMMFYNERLLKEAGVDEVPRTYSAYLAAGRKVTRDTNGDGQIDVWMGERDIRPIWWQRLFDFYPFYIAASEGKTLFEDGQPHFANNAAEEVFGFFQDCYTSGYFPRTFFQGGDLFLLEKKATNFAGPWQIPTIERYAPSMKYGVVPLPVPDDHQGPVYTYGDYKNIAIFSTTRHPNEAWEFVKFLVTNEHDLWLLEIANQIPVRGDLLLDSLFAGYFRLHPIMVQFARQAVYTRGIDAAPDLKEIFDSISQEYEACAVYGRKSPEQATIDALRRTKMIVEWNQ